MCDVLIKFFIVKTGTVFCPYMYYGLTKFPPCIADYVCCFRLTFGHMLKRRKSMYCIFYCTYMHKLI